MVLSEIMKRPPLGSEKRIIGLNEHDSQSKRQNTEMNGTMDSKSDQESEAGMIESLELISEMAEFKQRYGKYLEIFGNKIWFVETFSL